MFTISETERTINQERTVPVKSILDEPADREKNNSYIKDMDFLPALIRSVGVPCLFLLIKSLLLTVLERRNYAGRHCKITRTDILTQLHNESEQHRPYAVLLTVSLRFFLKRGIFDMHQKTNSWKCNYLYRGTG